MGPIVRSADTPQLTWGDLGEPSLRFGPKGARLLALPRPWVPPFALIDTDDCIRLLRGDLAREQQDALLAIVTDLKGMTGKVILRSSVIGETIWERGSFHSEIIADTGSPVDDLIAAAARVVGSAPGRRTALVIQSFVAPDEEGEFGNLLRLSKTRDHWELEVRGTDRTTTRERFNSQRSVAPSTSDTLEARRGLTRGRLFAEVAAWTNNELLRGGGDRVSYEWVRAGTRFYIVQLDREDEDTSGVNPIQIFIEPSINTGSGGELVREATPADRLAWDKLAVLDQLYDNTSPMVPSLYVLDPDVCQTKNRSKLEREFALSLGKNIVLRTSVRAGQDKIPNLKKSDCLTPSLAAAWVIEQANALSRQYPGTELAFIAHRYIAAKASAWVRAAPDNPIVEVNGTWGLPDALQFCPYDIWEVHVPTEDVTSYPAYKSNVLLLNPDGTWRYERVKNEVARFQSLSHQEVIDIAARAAAIAARLQKPCHVMWFVGCKDPDGREANIPWYWTEAHPVNLPDKRVSRVFDVLDDETLAKVPGIASRHRDVGIRLAPTSGDLLRDNAFLKRVADTVVPLGLPVYLTGSTLAHAYFQLAKHGCSVIPLGEKEHVRTRKHESYGKLVRDKIPDRIAAQQEKQRVATIPDQARLGYLVGKLIEEAVEVREATKPSDRLGELADVYEVVRAIGSLDDQAVSAIEAAANAKRDKAGGFEEGHLLIETSLPTAGDADLATVGTSTIPTIHPTTNTTIKIPFASLGFLELGQRVTVRLQALGLLVAFQMQKDGLEVTVASTEQQLGLDLDA